MTPKALGFDGIEGFRQLHGHDGSSNEEQSGVTNLNARNGRDFNPIAKVIEYAAETSRVNAVPVWG